MRQRTNKKNLLEQITLLNLKTNHRYELEFKKGYVRIKYFYDNLTNFMRYDKMNEYMNMLQYFTTYDKSRFVPLRIPNGNELKIDKK